jgi:hypothetical protein
VVLERALCLIEEGEHAVHVQVACDIRAPWDLGGKTSVPQGALGDVPVFIELQPRSLPVFVTVRGVGPATPSHCRGRSLGLPVSYLERRVEGTSGVLAAVDVPC